MHRVLVDKNDYKIAWIDGSDCLLAVAKTELIGFKMVSGFFSDIREYRSTSRASALILDIREIARLPDELWAWVSRSWYTQVTELGLKRQGIVAPLNLSAKMQWRGLSVPRLASKNFVQLSKAIQWVGADSHEDHPVMSNLSAVPA